MGEAARDADLGSAHRAARGLRPSRTPRQEAAPQGPAPLSADAVPVGETQAEAAVELLLEDVLDELDGVEVDDVDDEELLVLDDESDGGLAGVELVDEERESVR
ncbi:hypothetical protein KLO01_06580 [Knoellia locipacati]|uniref:Uncharacterized protein n=1 Tax=Knoellia locipacati TaxID=882824 RepID=A0A512SXD9_9MICO|nr:hypothetical protein KLO01_06580 [Knoellia locipacati]